MPVWPLGLPWGHPPAALSDGPKVRRSELRSQRAEGPLGTEWRSRWLLPPGPSPGLPHGYPRSCRLTEVGGSWRRSRRQGSGSVRPSSGLGARSCMSLRSGVQRWLPGRLPRRALGVAGAEASVLTTRPLHRGSSPHNTTAAPLPRGLTDRDTDRQRQRETETGGGGHSQRHKPSFCFVL